MHRTSSRVVLIVAAFALFLVPVAAIAAGGFTDVEEDSVFKADIEWLADAGVTKGCNPPTNDKFCPEENVTREQMAAFMHRLAANKVVDAATAIEANHAATADYATAADDANTLQGFSPNDFTASTHNHDADYLAVDGKATDSDKLDGLSIENIVPRASATDYYRAPGQPDGYEATVVIDVPARGIIIAHAGGNSYGGTAAQSCNLYLDNVYDMKGYGSVDHAQDSDADCTASSSIVVDPGVHTVGLYLTGNGAQFGVLWAMWVPFDGTGAVPASATVLGSIKLDEKDEE